jgi:surfactin synthase thioesterase subunit
VCPIQIPGRENRLREPAITLLRTLAATIADELEPLLDLPFAFYGHSLGAIVAFETARQLRQTGRALPNALFVSASRAPHLPWPHPPVRHLNDIDLLKEIHRRYGSVPTIVLADAELRELLTPALRADMNLIETYRYEPEEPFAFPIFAFGGDTDHMVGHAEITEWGSQTSGLFRFRMLPGDHLFLQSRREELLEDISSALGHSVNVL